MKKLEAENAGFDVRPDDEERLTDDIVELACRHGRLGYRKIAEMLRSTAGWIVNDKRVER
jgi:hypothetical protein